MAKKFSVDFYLRSNYTNKEGNTPIMVRLLGDGRVVSLGSTGLAIPKDKWDSKRKACKGRRGDEQYVNFQLRRIESELVCIFHRIEFSETYDIEQVKTLYLSKVKNTTHLLEYCDIFIKEQKERIDKTLTTTSLKKYELVKKHLAKYIRAAYKRDDMALVQLNHNFVNGFYLYQTTQLNLAPNTAMRRMRTAKTMILSAMKEGLLRTDPFCKFKVHFDPVDRGFLTQVEINCLLEAKFDQYSLERTRDLFIFSCFTGLAYIDMVQLTYDDIRDISHRLWIVSRRQKTKTASHIPLLPIPLAIMEKYKPKRPRKDNRVFPKISNQHVNKHLKIIAEQCGLQMRLTYHLARHTFATLALTNGTSLESVSKMLGHTNIKTTQHYAKIIDTKVMDEMEELEKKLSDLKFPN